MAHRDTTLPCPLPTPRASPTCQQASPRTSQSLRRTCPRHPSSTDSPPLSGRRRRICPLPCSSPTDTSRLDPARTRLPPTAAPRSSIQFLFPCSSRVHPPLVVHAARQLQATVHIRPTALQQSTHFDSQRDRYCHSFLI